jgi:hypothetical protein
MNDLELNIIIQKELDLCNEKIKKYDKKYKPEKKEQIELLVQYLKKQLDEEYNHTDLDSDVDSELHSEVEIDFNKKLLLDDIQTLNKYMNDSI